MQAVSKNELVFRPDLYVVARLQLTIAHVIFFHSHEGSVMICLAKAVSIPEDLLLGLVLLQTRK